MARPSAAANQKRIEGIESTLAELVSLLRNGAATIPADQIAPDPVPATETPALDSEATASLENHVDDQRPPKHRGHATRLRPDASKRSVKVSTQVRDANGGVRNVVTDKNLHLRDETREVLYPKMKREYGRVRFIVADESGNPILGSEGKPLLTSVMDVRTTSWNCPDGTMGNIQVGGQNIDFALPIDGGESAVMLHATGVWFSATEVY